MRAYLVTLAVGALLAIATPTTAGTIVTQCVPKASPDRPRECLIQFKGEIGPGDARLLEAAIRSAPSHVSGAFFDSRGGDPFEALKISDVINAAFVRFIAPLCPAALGRCVTSHESKVCASACALVFLTANERLGTEVFIHRATFPRALLAGLSGPQAQVTYNRSVDRLAAELRSRRVPETQIQLMTRTPSSNVTQMSSDYPRYSPWLEEWLTAKCGPERSSDGAIVRNQNCQSDAILAEQRRLQAKE